MCNICLAGKAEKRATRVSSGSCIGSPACPEMVLFGTKRCERHWWLRLAIGTERTADELREIWRSQGPVCPITGDNLILGLNVSLDHIIPKEKGGIDSVTNLRFVTVEANIMKWTMSDEDLLALCRKVVKQLEQPKPGC